jgi:hypothetical protein
MVDVPLMQALMKAVPDKPVATAVRNASGRRRWSKLAEWLCPAQRIGMPN